jgi:endonuclease YncB( thermonuclease family)
MLILLLACIPVEKNPDPDTTGDQDSIPWDTADDQATDDARVRALTGLPEGDSPCMSPMIVRVTEVVDGDTFWSSRDDDGSSLKIRMIGVDTPEVDHPDEPEECYGNEAWRRSIEALEGNLVWLTFDGECLDIYDRTLAYVFRDATEEGFWDRNLARNGFAEQLTIPPNDSFADLIETDVQAAQQENLGLWADCR